MTQVVEVPGQGEVEFPDSMTDAQIATFLRGQQGTKNQSFLSELGRQLAVGTRAVGTGVASVATVPGDFLNSLINLGSAGINKVAGTSIPSLKMPSNVVESALTRAGVPEPQSALGRILYAMEKGGASAAVPIPGLNAAFPIASGVSGMLSGGSSQLAAEAGAPPIVQFGAGLAGGIGIPMATSAGAGLVAPLIGRGREQIVGNTLNRFAMNPGAAQIAAQSAKEYVPGSLPTTGQATSDIGLISLERGLLNQAPNNALLAGRYEQQNAARSALLGDLAQTPEALNAAIAARKAASDPFYKSGVEGVGPLATAAFGVTDPNLARDVINVVARLDKSPILNKASQLAALEGIDLRNPANSMRGLQFIKMALDDSIENSFSGGIGKTEKRALTQVRSDLLDVMGKISPDYAKANAAFKAGSVPVNQMETLQDIQSRVTNAATTTTGENVVSPAKWFNVVTKNSADLKKVLSADQMQILENIGSDLDRGARLATAGKAVGSNTMQNLSTANVLGALLTRGAAQSPAVQSLARPLSWLYKLPEQAVQDLMYQAMLDPKLAAQLMTRASTNNLAAVGDGLSRKALQLGYGPLIGSQQSAPDQR